jgi:hypothetical protein
VKTAEFSIAEETRLSLFPIYGRLPKLDVVGSSPISRSISQEPRKPGPLRLPLSEAPQIKEWTARYASAVWTKRKLFT